MRIDHDKICHAFAVSGHIRIDCLIFRLWFSFSAWADFCKMYQAGRAWGTPLQPQQKPRLPPGWEAKWDPQSNKWFYIDHRTKTTHWEPPPASAWYQQPSQPQRVTTSFIEADPEKVKILMSEYERVSTDIVKSKLCAHQNNIESARKDLSNIGYKKKVPQARIEPKLTFVNSLKDQYPSASEDVIKEVLVSTANNYAGAKLSLEAMGYRKTGVINTNHVDVILGEYEGITKDHAESMLRIYGNRVADVKRTLDDKGFKKKKTSAAPNPRLVTTLRNKYHNAGEDVIKQVLSNTSNNLTRASTSLESMGYKTKSDLRNAAKANAKKATSSDDLSDAAKKSMLQKLKKKFPTVVESVVELSLVGTMYDMEMAESILKDSLESVQTRSSTSITSSTATRAAYKETVSTEPTEFKSTSYTPVIFEAEEETKPAPESVTTYLSTGSSIDLPPARKAESAYKKREYVPPARKVHSRTKAPVTGYVSSNRCQPAGPDPTLVSGPNPLLLQAQLIKATGPDPANRAGPQKYSRCGPVASNAQGRAGIDVGPMRGRLLTTWI